MIPLSSASSRRLLLDLVIPGEPPSKERPRFANGRAYTSKKTRDDETTVIRYVRLAYPRLEPTTHPVAVELRFYLSTNRRRDMDNMAKLVWDALNGIAWVDDTLIHEAHIWKVHRDANPRTELTVYSLEAP